MGIRGLARPLAEPWVFVVKAVFTLPFPSKLRNAAFPGLPASPIESIRCETGEPLAEVDRSGLPVPSGF